MSNQPPYPGSPDQGPEEPPTRHKGGDPQQGTPPAGNQGAPPQHNPYGAPPQQNNPYGQPPQQNQPPWQGHQAPQQGYGPGGQPQWQPGPYGPGQGGPGGQQKSKKKWLIPVIAIVAVLVVVGGIFAAMSLGGDFSSGTAVDDLSEGDCLVSSDISEASDSIGDIETVDCGDDHDAEVFATYDVGADDAGSDFDLDAAGSTCVDKLSDTGTTLDDLEADGNEVRPLVGSDEPSEGDQVVCFIRNSDGDQLSESVIG